MLRNRLHKSTKYSRKSRRHGRVYSTHPSATNHDVFLVWKRFTAVTEPNTLVAQSANTWIGLRAYSQYVHAINHHQHWLFSVAS